MLDETRDLLKHHGGLISICLLFVFFSVFGQSVFFGVYLPMIQHDLHLSKTAIGLLYAEATIASSIVIMFTGKGLDHFPLRNFIVFVLCGLSLGCFVMAGAHTAVMLLLAFFLLRQFGQGLMIISSSATINRYLSENRGKAMALTTLGSSLQLLIFPLLALHLDEYINWRQAWIYYGVFILFILLPAFWMYLKSHQQTTHARWAARVREESEHPEVSGIYHWTRREVLKDWRFYGFISIAMIGPFVSTAIFFYQRELATSLSVTPIAFATSFVFFTASMIIASFSSGAIIDKYGEKPALILYPILYSTGLFLFTQSHTSLLISYVAMIFIGAANGIMATTGGPLIANLYGTKYLSSVKSVFVSSSILASALSPFIFGYFLDKGYDILTLFSYVIIYSGIIWLMAFPICGSGKNHLNCESVL